MEVVNIYGAVDGQMEMETGERIGEVKRCVNPMFGVKGEWSSAGKNEAVIVLR